MACDVYMLSHSNGFRFSVRVRRMTWKASENINILRIFQSHGNIRLEGDDEGSRIKSHAMAKELLGEPYRSLRLEHGEWPITELLLELKKLSYPESGDNGTGETFVAFTGIVGRRLTFFSWCHRAYIVDGSFLIDVRRYLHISHPVVCTGVIRTNTRLVCSTIVRRMERRRLHQEESGDEG